MCGKSHGAVPDLADGQDLDGQDLDGSGLLTSIAITVRRGG